MAFFDDGNSEYLYIDDPIISSTTWGASMWFRIDGDGTSQTIFGIGDKDVSDEHYLVQADMKLVGDPLTFTSQDASGTDTVSAGTITAGQWHHAMVRQVNFPSPEIRAWLDGSDLGGDTVGHTPTGLDRLAIGGKVTSSSKLFFGGEIAEVAVWQGVTLVGADAIALASGASPLMVKPAGLLAYWPLVASLVDRIEGLTLTESPAPDYNADHPPVIWPASPQSAVPSAVTKTAYFYSARRRRP